MAPNEGSLGSLTKDTYIALPQELAIPSVSAGSWKALNGEKSEKSILIEIILVTGNSELLNNSFTYYPNPVQNILQIESNSGIKVITVRNTLGNLIVKEFNTSTIDLTNIEKGTYIVLIEFDQNSKTIKVIKD